VSKTAVIAFGGNALVTDAEHDSIPDQYETVCRTISPLVDLIAQGWRLVVTHGNGPQVGFILRRSELSQAEVDPVPLDYAVADTQGAIGYMFVKALNNELARRGLVRPSWPWSRSPSSIRRTKRSAPASHQFLLNEATAPEGARLDHHGGRRRGWRRTPPLAGKHPRE
jgi:hypothetical protein